MQTTTSTDSTTKLSAIERALEAAKARKAQREAEDGPQDEVTETKVKASAAAAEKVKKVTSPDFAKQQKKEALTAARSAAKAVRDAERQKRREEKAARAVNKNPTHMKKVARAASKLPALNESAQTHFDELTTNLGRVQIAALALHLQHFNRMKATEMSAGRRFKTGQQVRIVAGDLDNLNKIGTIESARPLRVFVNVPGVKKPVYVFTSEVELVNDASVKSTGTEG